MLEKQTDTQDKIAIMELELIDHLEINMTVDERAQHSNAYRLYREDKQKLISNRGKVYNLLLGHCTTVVKDRLVKEDADWIIMSDAYNIISLS